MNENLDIINILEQYVNTLAKEHWKNSDNCPPKFWFH